MDDSSKTQSSLRDTPWWVWVMLIVITLLAISLIWGVVSLVGVVWEAFTDLDKTIATAIVAGIFTVIATTITVMVGRYFEEKRKQSELHRDRKIKMYDAFIARIFKLFADDDIEPSESETKSEAEELELIQFLREHQRQFLLWSNPGVIRAFAEWRKALNGEPNAQTVLKMEKFFFAVRRDLGHSNLGIKRGDTVRFILRHTDFFLQQIKINPNIKLSELAQLENEAGLTESDY